MGLVTTRGCFIAAESHVNYLLTSTGTAVSILLGGWVHLQVFIAETHAWGKAAAGDGGAL